MISSFLLSGADIIRKGFCFDCCGSPDLGLTAFENTICRFGCSFADGTLLVDPSQCFSFPNECNIGRNFYDFGFGNYINETVFCSEGGVVGSSFAPTSSPTTSAPTIFSTQAATDSPTRTNSANSSQDPLSAQDMMFISGGVTFALLRESLSFVFSFVSSKSMLVALFAVARTSKGPGNSAPQRPKSVKYVPAPQLLNRSAINPGSPIIDTRRYKSR